MPSGLKLTSQIERVCPAAEGARPARLRSHSRTERSRLPEARRRPSGLKLTLTIPAVCPVSGTRLRPLRTSHKRTFLS